jgi:putative ATP-dependent endonuclease of OLD family
MKIRRLTIKNFRNFQNLTVELDNHAVIVGPNGVGKSNLLHAIRLVLDPSLPDSLRQLREEDFWDGVTRPLWLDASIEISVELTDFEQNDDQLASLAEHLVEPDPMVARLTYVFRAKSTAVAPLATDDFEFFVFGGDREDNRVGYELRRRIPADVFHALRDAEGDLATWRRSPLRPLLERAWSQVAKADKENLAKGVEDASTLLTQTKPLEELRAKITKALTTRAGGGEATDVNLGIGSTEPDTLIRIVRLLLDEGRRSIGETSLGLANLLFFTLKLLELGYLVDEHERDHTFVAIEEPEAHLHPHLQRQMFRSLLRLKPHLSAAEDGALEALPTTILVTTHSPHVASIAPLKSIVLLRRVGVEIPIQGAVGAPVSKVVATTVAASTAHADFDEKDAEDIERYLEVSRAELLFARGVVLVEGDAEQYLVPRIATLHGKPLDALGISVCSVGGVHFKSYVRLLLQLKIPFVVITDGDPLAPVPGAQRVIDLLEIVLGEVAFKAVAAGQHRAEAARCGLFVGDVTFEDDLLAAGRGRSISRALKDLAPSKAAGVRADGWLANVNSIDPTQMLKDIVEIGKGRFAQRLASILPPRRAAHGPKFVIDAIDHLAAVVAL